MTEAELARHSNHVVCVWWQDAHAVLNANPKHRDAEPAPVWRTYGELREVTSTRVFVDTSILADGSAADWREIPMDNVLRVFDYGPAEPPEPLS